MKNISKIFVGFCLAFVVVGSAFIGTPLLSYAANSGWGCVVPAPAPATGDQTLCSTRTDCSDLVDLNGGFACSVSSPCRQLAACNDAPPIPTPNPSSTPTPTPDPGSTYSPPNLPINTNLPIPNAVPISGPGGQGPAGLIANFYSFAFLIAGFLAFVMIVYGGVRYTFSGGNHSYKEEAKEAIKQALIGLGLLLVAYLILRTINPDLTKLQLPTLAPYTPVPVATGPTTPADSCGGCAAGSECRTEDGTTYICVALESTCTAARPLSRMTGDAAAMENGNTVVFSSSNPDIQRNLSRLSNAVAGLQEGVAALGGRAVVNSAYRPYQYQRHFREICDRRTALANNTDAGCATLKSEVEAERVRHGINEACVVAPANGCAPHVKGVGVDLTITGVSQAQINSIIARENVGLRWVALQGDPFHYELVNPPFAGCAPNS